MAVNVGTKTAAKPLCGYITLESDDCNIEPFHFPFQPTGSHLGVTPHTARGAALKFLVNCPVPGGARIDAYCTLGVAAPQGAPEVIVCIEFSDIGVMDQQIHMSVLEPSGAAGTTVDTETTLSTITIKGAHRIIGLWAVAEVETPVADESLMHSLEIRSSEFAVSGPETIPLEPKEETDATTGFGELQLTFVECDRDIKPSVSEAVLTPKITNYDANNAAPEVYVGVAYV